MEGDSCSPWTTTTTTTTTPQPQPWDWGGLSYGGFTFSFQLVLDVSNNASQALFMKTQKTVDPPLGVKARLPQGANTPTTPGSTQWKQLYLDTHKRLCFKVGSGIHTKTETRTTTAFLVNATTTALYPPMGFFGYGCCRFEGWRAIFQGYQSEADCQQLCVASSPCVAVEIARPVGWKYECFLFRSPDGNETSNFRTGCGTNDAFQKCFKKTLTTTSTTTTTTTGDGVYISNLKMGMQTLTGSFRADEGELPPNVTNSAAAGAALLSASGPYIDAKREGIATALSAVSASVPFGYGPYTVTKSDVKIVSLTFLGWSAGGSTSLRSLEDVFDEGLPIRRLLSANMLQGEEPPKAPSSYRVTRRSLSSTARQEEVLTEFSVSTPDLSATFAVRAALLATNFPAALTNAVSLALNATDFSGDVLFSGPSSISNVVVSNETSIVRLTTTTTTPATTTGQCVQRPLTSGGGYNIVLKSSPEEGYILSVDGVEEHPDHEPLRPDDPGTEFLFGVNVDDNSLERFTGAVRNVTFSYHDGTSAVSATESVVGLSPEAVFPSPWTLILRGNLSSISSLGDFSSGASVGADLFSGDTGEDYRIGLTGAEIHAYAPTRLRIQTSGGLAEEFSGPFDFRALDGVCTTLGNCTNCTNDNNASCSCTGNALRSDLHWHGGRGGCPPTCACVPDLYWHFGLSRGEHDLYSVCSNGTVPTSSTSKWGHFHRPGRNGTTGGVYVFGDVCVPEDEYVNVMYSFYVMTTTPITTSTTTTTLPPQAWDWGGTLHGGFTLSFLLTIDASNNDAQGLFMRLHTAVEDSTLGFLGLEQADEWASVTTPGATLKQLYLNQQRKICFKAGVDTRWGHCHPRRLSGTHKIVVRGFSLREQEGYVIAVDGKEGHDSRGYEKLSPDDPGTEIVFGVRVENPNYSYDRYRLSRFTGRVENVTFAYFDGTIPVVSPTDVVRGLSPAAIYPTPWTLLLRSDLSSGSFGDFSSGEQVGESSFERLSEKNYRIGMSGAQMQQEQIAGRVGEGAPTRLRIRTSLGLSADFVGPFDFRALDDVCTTCTEMETTCTSGGGGTNCSLENCTSMGSNCSRENCTSCNCTGKSLSSNLYWHGGRGGCATCTCVPDGTYHFGLTDCE